MDNPIHKLYQLKSAEGQLSWKICNGINRQLLSMSHNDVPDDQIENVCEYIVCVLRHESELLSHRSILKQMLHFLLARHA